MMWSRAGRRERHWRIDAKATLMRRAQSQD
jgi:hypothetical protein